MKTVVLYGIVIGLLLFQGSTALPGLTDVVLGLKYPQPNSVLQSYLQQALQVSEEDVHIRSSGKRGRFVTVTLQTGGTAVSSERVAAVVDSYQDCVSDQLTQGKTEIDCCAVSPVAIDTIPSQYFELVLSCEAGISGTQRRMLFSEGLDASATERAALELFYDHLGGSNWFIDVGWKNSSTPVCDWFGVECETVDSETHVTELRLSENGLLLGTARRRPRTQKMGILDESKIPTPLPTTAIHGAFMGVSPLDRSGDNDSARRAEGDTLPVFTDEIMEGLPYLRVVELSYNNLAGTLPANIDKLVSLEQLGIFNSALAGSVPPSITNLPQLTVLDIGSSSGHCPVANEEACEYPFESKLLFRTWPAMLQSGKGIRNIVSGPIDPVFDLPNLEIFDANMDSMEGIVFDERLCERPLRAFDVTGNLLHGTIPDCIGNLRDLRVFDIFGVPVSGTLPASLGETSIVHMIVGVNSLTGTVPPELGKLTDIVQLHFHDNFITGTLPEELCSLQYVQSFLIFNNQLEGTIPQACSNLGSRYGGVPIFLINTNGLSGGIDWASNWTAGYLFHANDNQFDSTLPSSGFTNMVDLRLGKNLFVGTIPDSMFSPARTTLDLDNNPYLTGSLPESMSSASALRTFAMEGSALSGSLPAAICQMESIQRLELKDMARITGTLPACLGDMSSLRWLHLENLGISGGLPENIGGATALETLTIRGCKLDTETLPFSLADLQNLVYVDLSYNELAGEIRRYLYQLGSSPLLNTIDLSYNMLWGSLPSDQFITTGTVVKFASLQSFLLNDNQLSGSIPGSVGQLTELRVFDISNNNFTGALSSWISALDVLRASGNNLGCGSESEQDILLHCTERIPDGLVVASELFVDYGDHISCPQLSSSEKSSIVVLDPTYYNKTLCRCQIGTYGDRGECLPCMKGGLCRGGSYLRATNETGAIVSLPIGVPLNQRYVIEAPVVALAGYFPTPSEDHPEEMVECLPDSLSSERCNPNESTEFECATEYQGRACGSCSDGYFAEAGRCSECPSPAVARSVIVVISLVVAAAAVLVVQQNERFLRFLRYTKWFLFYLQSMSLIITKSTLSWPDEILTLHTGIAFANFGLGFLACTTADTSRSVYDEFVVSALTPVYVVLISVAAGVIVYSYERLTFKVPSIPVRQTVFSILVGWNLIYLPITTRVLEVFTCEADPVTGKEYVVAHPDLECDPEGEWGSMRSGSIAITVLFIAGFPLTTLALVLLNRDAFLTTNGESKTTPGVLVLKFMYSAYGANFLWMELWTFARRLVLGAFASLLALDSAMVAFFLMVMLTVSLLVHLHSKPYSSRYLNMLEGLALGVLCFTFACGVILTLYGASTTITVVMICVNLLVVLAFAQMCGLILILNWSENYNSVSPVRTPSRRPSLVSTSDVSRKDSECSELSPPKAGAFVSHASNDNQSNSNFSSIISLQRVLAKSRKESFNSDFSPVSVVPREY